MKYLILIVLTFSFSKHESSMSNNTYVYNVATVSENFYNRLAIAQRIKSYTNRHIDTKANKRGNIPSSLINQIQSGVNYSTFKSDVIAIMNSHYSQQQMQNAIDNSRNLPYINITSPKIKKELNDAVIRFWNTVDQSMNTILINNGF